ncbi:unnamed protein product [Prorocentrum cordatum]|uniref:Uncharacterized protein n=1 Tax=Prorocentrum cordatum TaxID=2364126 RepID=A0ABN9VAF3_9DINO|nr:unnamed protein product [Polarella glacialis]
MQPDGSSVLVCADGSTVRWTRRLDGSWRPPERKREGWVGELEADRYVVPGLRDTGRPLVSRVAVERPRQCRHAARQRA